MRYSAIVALLAMLSACGGTTNSDPVVENIVSSNNTLTSTPTAIDIVPTPVSNLTGDITFGDLLNGVRAQNGADPVTYNNRLDRAAQSHAQDMLDNNYFSHTGLDGSTIGTRVQAEGYNFSRVGENIASGYRTEQSVLTGWVNSPGHQRNNVDPNFEEFGLGYARGNNGTRWVLVLGTEQ